MWVRLGVGCWIKHLPQDPWIPVITMDILSLPSRPAGKPLPHSPVQPQVLSPNMGQWWSFLFKRSKMILGWPRPHYYCLSQGPVSLRKEQGGDQQNPNCPAHRLLPSRPVLCAPKRKSRWTKLLLFKKVFIQSQNQSHILVWVSFF
jgi:hypothetical protein